MIHKVLVAGRGVLACRIMRTCREMGIATVAVYTSVDGEALHVALADEAVHLGSDVASYHNQQAILDAMQRSGADALHPVDGPFASAPGFAYFIKGAGMTFIGPAPECIEAMQDSHMSRQFLHDIPQVSSAVIEPLRHIEVQIAADQDEMVVVLGEREVTLQVDDRPYLVEAPVSNIHQAARVACRQLALRIVEQLGYTGIGTVHLVLDGQDRVYFDHMATHLTTSFAATEAVTSVDLIRLQLEVAQGGSLLDVLPSDIDLDEMGPQARGYAVQGLVHAQTLKSTSQLLHLQLPSVVWVDVGCRQYQPLTDDSDLWLLSLTAQARRRSNALRLLDYALSELSLLGLENNVAALRQVLRDPAYRPGTDANQLLEAEPVPLLEQAESHTLALIAIAIVKASSMLQKGVQKSLRLRFEEGDETHNITLTIAEAGHYRIVLADMIHNADVIERSETRLTLSLNGHRQSVVVASNEQHDCWIQTRNGVFCFVWRPPTLPTQTSPPPAG